MRVLPEITAITMTDQNRRELSPAVDHSQLQSRTRIASKRRAASREDCQNSFNNDAGHRGQPTTLKDGEVDRSEEYTADSGIRLSVERLIKRKRTSRIDNSISEQEYDEGSNTSRLLSTSSKPKDMDFQIAKSSSSLRPVPVSLSPTLEEFRNTAYPKLGAEDCVISVRALERMKDEINELEKGIKAKDNRILKQSDQLDWCYRQFKDKDMKYQKIAALAYERKAQVAKIKEVNKALEGERDFANAKVDELIRAQQLESFKRIESAHWIPREESQVKDDLENLKRMMRNVAKEFAVAIMPDLSEIGDGHALMANMQEVIRFGNGANPLEGMNRHKSAAVVLNALLAHAVYSRVFRPAFAFNENPETGLNPLADMYHETKRADPEGAHAWRAQTLRLLYPQLTRDANDTAMALHTATENKIVQGALAQAERFMNMEASVLIKPAKHLEAYARIYDIFQRAAHLSYELWTRKTALEVATLSMAREPAYYHINDPCTVPHVLVKYDEHEEELNGRPIRLVVHPLVAVLGDDEGGNFDKSRILMPAEVWLPNQDDAEKEHGRVDSRGM